MIVWRFHFCNQQWQICFYLLNYLRFYDIDMYFIFLYIFFTEVHIFLEIA